MQIQAIETIRIPHDANPQVQTAAAELARWTEQLGGAEPRIGTHAEAGTVTAWLDIDGTHLEPEHFRIAVEESTTLRISGGDGRGVLYGVQECIDRARRGQAIGPMTEGPVFALRALDMWENISGQIWCLPFDSILDYDKMLHAEEIPEYQDFARLLLSMRVNSLLLSSQYAAGGSLFERWLSHAESIEQFAQFMDHYGVAIRLALHYVSPDDQGNYATVCPFSDTVRETWEDFVARMAISMPTVRNVRVRGSGEESPGPHEDNCDRCSALPIRERMLAGIQLVSDAVATIGGTVEWLAWADHAANVQAEVDMFGDWGDELPQNVRIEHCHHYWDVRPPYPLHPIWDHIGTRPGQRSPYAFEIALVLDTGGMNFLPCSMAHRWHEEFRRAADQGYEGADANMAVHPEYVDHPLNLSNWYAFGRLCWNPYIDPDDILREWLIMEYGDDAVAFLPGLRDTYPAAIGALFSRSGLTQCHSYVSRYNYMDTRLNGPWSVWTDYVHPGMDRVGEDILGMEMPLDAYPEAESEVLRNDPQYQLIFNRVPLTEAYAAELMAEKQEAIGHMKNVLATWQQLDGKIEPDSYTHVSGLLEANVNDVRIFVDCFALYLDYKLGRLEAAQIEALREHYADVPKGEATAGSPYDGWFWDHFGWQGTYLEFLDDLDKLLRGETLGRFLAGGPGESQTE